MVLTDQPGDESWPITALTYILKYFNWCYTTGANAASKLHYVPLAEVVVELVRKAWADEIRVNGSPVAL